MVKDYSEIHKALNCLKNRKKPTILSRLKGNVMSLIMNSLRKNGYKKTGKIVDILGCSYEEFKQHLESKFEPWMNWDNYGKYNGSFNYGWEIDHVIPNCFAINESHALQLNHFVNFQPLCTKINREIKKDNLIY